MGVLFFNFDWIQASIGA